jgi:hypothetical protein
VGPIYFFPNMDVQIGRYARQTGFIGHGGATAFIGLAIGLARLLAARRGGRRGDLWRLAWFLPLFVWGWMVFDHGMFNYAQDPARLPLLPKVLYTIDGRGYLSSVLLYLLIVATIVFERWLLRRGRERTAGLRWTGAGRLLAVPVFLVALARFLRERRGLAYGLYTYVQGGERDAAQLAYLDRVAAGLRRLKRRLERPAV